MHSGAASQGGGGWQGCGAAAHIFCIRALTVGSAIIVFICSMIIGFCIIFIACCTTAGSRICSCSDDGAPPSAASSASSPPRSRSAERGSTAGRDADEAREDATAALVPADAHANVKATRSDLILLIEWSRPAARGAQPAWLAVPPRSARRLTAFPSGD